MKLLRASVLGTLTALAAGLLALPSCTISTPLRKGPAMPGRGTVILAVTHARLVRARRGEFDRQTRLVSEGLSGQAGLIAWSLRRELLGDEVWTLTVWSDEEALDRFVYEARHRQAMGAGRPALRATRFARAEMAASELPVRWRTALDLLEQSRPFEESEQ